MVNIKYTKQLIEETVSGVDTWADACRKLGIKPASGSQSHLKRRADDFQVDYSHFVGRKTDKGNRRGSHKKPIAHYLRKGFRTGSHNLKLRLIKEGLKAHRCEVCNLTEWQGQPVPIELDHIDGDHENNLLENLRVICPNCHAQTDTHAGKNRNKANVG